MKVIAVRDQAGVLRSLICPNCDTHDDIAEVQTAERWNRLSIAEDGTLTSHVSGDEELDAGYWMCKACLETLQSDVDIDDWVIE